MNQGKFDLALADINQAIALNPNFEKAYVRRSFINLEKGDYAQTIANLNEIIQRDPQDVTTYNRLGWLLAVCPDSKFRNGPEAVKNATKACDLTQWNRPAFIDTLAAAYAEAGDFNNAVKWETQFLAMQNIDAGNHSDAQDRLALYQAKQPYHVVKFTPELGMAVLGDEARQN
jgi:tetratricopeptide (TPR) repeat protein